MGKIKLLNPLVLRPLFAVGLLAVLSNAACVPAPAGANDDSSDEAALDASAIGARRVNLSLESRSRTYSYLCRPKGTATHCGLKLVAQFEGKIIDEADDALKAVTYDASLGPEKRVLTLEANAGTVYSRSAGIGWRGWSWWSYADLELGPGLHEITIRRAERLPDAVLPTLAFDSVMTDAPLWCNESGRCYTSAAEARRIEVIGTLSELVSTDILSGWTEERPVAGERVELMHRSESIILKTVTSDGGGTFTLSDVGVGDYRLRVRDGYYPIRVGGELAQLTLDPIVL